MPRGQRGRSGGDTFHVPLTLINDKCIASVRLLSCLGRDCVFDDPDLAECQQPTRFMGMRGTASYSLNGSKAAELSLQVGVLNVVAESCNKESAEWITSSVRIILWVVYYIQDVVSRATPMDIFEKRMRTVLQALRQRASHLVFPFQLLAPLALQPALSGIVRRLLLEGLCFREKLGDAGDSTLLAVLWGAVGRRDIAQRGSGLEKCQQRRGKFIRHDQP